jgi:hypothetical protein
MRRPKQILCLIVSAVAVLFIPLVSAERAAPTAATSPATKSAATPAATAAPVAAARTGHGRVRTVHLGIDVRGRAVRPRAGRMTVTSVGDRVEWGSGPVLEAVSS